MSRDQLARDDSCGASGRRAGGTTRAEKTGVGAGGGREADARVDDDADQRDDRGGKSLGYHRL